MSFTIEPDHGPTRWHRRVVKLTPLPNTRTGQLCRLECGHMVQTFGNLEHVRRGPTGDVMVLCTECRAASKEL